MIYVKYVYKGSVVEVLPINQAYTQRNIANIRGQIASGKIKSPENHERYFISDVEENNLYVG